MLNYRMREGERAYFPRPEGMSPTLHALLIQRGIATAEQAEEFLHPSASRLRDPMLLSDMGPATAAIRAAMENGEPICVYGDYDVDGVSASAILAGYLRAQGAKAEVYLPSRHSEGYGLNEPAIRAIAQRSRLMVTVDCGVTSVELIDLAKSLGLTCVVTDHHRPAERLPACPVVNPLLNDYPFGFLCGAGVAFKLVEALGGRAAAMEYVDIAALATVADVVPLIDENRILVRLGLERINAAPRPGLKALIEAAGLSDAALTAGNIGFQLAPRLNAGGRIGSAKRSYDLLAATDPAEAATIAAELEEENRTRRDVEEQIQLEAEAQLESFDFPAHRALVLAGKDWNPGVIGLTASRLVEKYHYPTILLSERDGVLTGSCRSIPGVDIHAALTAVKHLLVKYGGHRQAAGLTLAADRLDDFRTELDAWLFQNIPSAAYVPEMEYDLSVHFSELTAAFVQELDALAPTGFGNPAPVLRATAIPVEAKAVGRDGAHLRLTLSESGVQRGGIFFREGRRAGKLPPAVDALFTPKLNTFMSRTDVQLEMKALRSDDPLKELSSKIDGEDELQREFLTEVLYNNKINPEARGGQAISMDELSALLEENAQGTLILAGDLAIAGRILDAARGAPPDLWIREAPEDPRLFNALCVYPPASVPGRWRRVVRAGVPRDLPLPEGAEILNLDFRPAWMDELPDVDGLREVYKAFRALSRRPFACDSPDDLFDRASAQSGLSFIACTVAALALHDMRLIQLTLDSRAARFDPLPMRRTDPESSAVWRRVRGWRENTTL